MMSETNIDIRIGTSGYDYPEWAGVLYPSEIKRSNYLEYYSKVFTTLELNFSYYGMPKEITLLNMINRAQSSMDFSIKAHQSLTHNIDQLKLKDYAKEYREGIHPLIRFNRLAAILFEFPFSFYYQPDNRKYLDKLLQEFTEYPIVIEFRNKDWYNQRVLDELMRRKICLCLMDMPENAMPTDILPTITSDLIYIRFHGRNAINWWNGNNVSRYDYLYNKDEMRDWSIKIIDMEEKVKTIRIYFNNHARGNAVQNARMLNKLINIE
jgi:uncharacterized protein YecE (DUF72 family)